MLKLRWIVLVIIVAVITPYVLKLQKAKPEVRYQNFPRKEELISAYAKLRLVNRIYGTTSAKAQQNRLSVLQAYNWDKSTFAQSIDSLKANPIFWVFFQKDVIDSLEVWKKSRQNEIHKGKQKGPSNSLNKDLKTVKFKTKGHKK